MSDFWFQVNVVLKKDLIKLTLQAYLRFLVGKMIKKLKYKIIQYPAGVQKNIKIWKISNIFEETYLEV